MVERLGEVGVEQGVRDQRDERGIVDECLLEVRCKATDCATRAELAR
jgi:hypothetical protein